MKFSEVYYKSLILKLVGTMKPISLIFTVWTINVVSVYHKPHFDVSQISLY